jgi:hypothetical protein
MLMLAYLGDIPILGLPGCVMYHSTTVFDLVLPRMLVGEKLSRKDIIQLGHGGLCSSCPECRFPDCAFGKGGELVDYTSIDIVRNSSSIIF